MLRLIGSVLALTLVGCASTGGRDWLNSPVDAVPTPAEPALAADEPKSDARPRLDHTVTLAGSDAAVPRDPLPPGIAYGPTVQVNVPVTINTHGAYGYGYGYGVGYGRPYGTITAGGGVGTSPSVTRSASTSQVGQNWPAVHDYGPKAMR